MITLLEYLSKRNSSDYSTITQYKNVGVLVRSDVPEVQDFILLKEEFDRKTWEEAKNFAKFIHNGELPSESQWKIIHENLDKINEIINKMDGDVILKKNFFWTSTEVSPNRAKVYFDGEFDPNGKDAFVDFRVVVSFK